MKCKDVTNRAIKLEAMRLARHVACMGVIMNAFYVLDGGKKMKITEHLEKIALNDSIILKWTLKK
jgi:translation initiation factor 1 (eIF-1/SUI1)